MRVLIGCEESGVVRDAFRARGHNAWSCDLVESEDDTYHLQMDVRKAIELGGWDLIILHPDCSKMALSGNRWYGKGTEGHQERVEAVEWTVDLWELALENGRRVALENPTSVIFPVLRKFADVQYIQPYEYGHKESKKTGFALHNLPRLIPTQVFEKPKTLAEWNDWQKVWRMAPSPERKKMRSRTYEGIAAAIAEQWGNL
ncbi:DNA cytosine methyltransferase [bacterium]|nr:DNA cytosine methyltransferase [bacterium]